MPIDWSVILATAIDSPSDRFEITTHSSGRPCNIRCVTPSGTFAIVVRDSHSNTTLDAVDRQIHEAREHFPATDVWVFGTAHMPPAAVARASELGLNWMDGAGNAMIRAPHLRVRVIGQKPAAPEVQPQPLITAPSERQVAAALLALPLPVRAGTLVNTTDVHPAQVNRLLLRLSEKGLIVRGQRGAVVGVERAPLLNELRLGREKDSWRWRRGELQDYSGRDVCTELVRRVVQAGQAENYALSGLAAAALLTGEPVPERAVKIYVSEEELLGVDRFRDDIGFAYTPDGPLAIQTPLNRSVFLGATSPQGFRCVAPPQVYLDLDDDELDTPEAMKLFVCATSFRTAKTEAGSVTDSASTAGSVVGRAHSAAFFDRSGESAVHESASARSVQPSWLTDNWPPRGLLDLPLHGGGGAPKSPKKIRN